MSATTVFQLAIDGPVAAGKGTVSKLIADRLGILYVDTGAMYRTATLLAMRNEIALDDEAGIVKAVEASRIEVRRPSNGEQDGRKITVLLDGEDISWQIRTQKVSNSVAEVATLPGVRTILVKKQQEIATQTSVVMEGRDITYRVLPDANLKIFLTATDVARAKRRMLQLQGWGQDVSFDEVYAELIKRDKLDMERGKDPLKIVDDAWVIDTTDLSIEQVVDMVVRRCQLMME